jgi:hypothetical protein
MRRLPGKSPARHSDQTGWPDVDEPTGTPASRVLPGVAIDRERALRDLD